MSRRATYRHAIACPHCKSNARVRTSRGITSTYRQMSLECGNVECGHTFGAELTITHTISPSACPDPEVHLRIAPPRIRRADNDNLRPARDTKGAAIMRQSGPEVPPPPAANDDIGHEEAVPIGR